MSSIVLILKGFPYYELKNPFVGNDKISEKKKPGLKKIPRHYLMSPKVDLTAARPVNWLEFTSCLRYQK